MEAPHDNIWITSSVTEMLIISVALLAQTASVVTTMPIDEHSARAQVSADYLEFSGSEDPRLFAEELLATELLTSWNEWAPTSYVTPDFEVIGLVTRDGRSVRILFSGSGACRIRALTANGTGPAAYDALRWCALKFGVELPATPALPVPNRKVR